MARRVLAFGAVTLMALRAEPAGAQRTGDDARSRIDTTVAFARTGTVELFLPSGDITVTGWDRAEVRVRAASAQGSLELEITGSHLSLGANAVRRRLGDTAFEVWVPSGAKVTMRTYSGDLVARGIAGDVAADVGSGDIDVSDLGGRVTLATTSGQIRGERLSGPVRAAAVSGNVALANVSGELDASTTTGALTLASIRARTVRAGSINGNIDYRGDLAAGGTYTFSAHAGNIVLALSDDASASMRLSTHGGHVESEIPLTLREGQLRGTGRLNVTLGGGDATVIGQTHSGNIIIRRVARANH